MQPPTAIYTPQISDQPPNRSQSATGGWKIASLPLMGFLASVIVVVGGMLAGAAGPAGSGELWSAPAIPVEPRIGILPALALFYGGMILLVRSWLNLRRAVLEDDLRIGLVVAIAAIWALPLLLGPPLASRDVYAYVAQGELASEGFNVYEVGPGSLGENPVLAPVDPLYLDSPVVYGPVFVAVSDQVATRTNGIPGAVGLFRLLAVASLAIASLAVWSIARSLGRNPVDAVVLTIANPLAMLHLVSGAHNESMMVAVLLAGVAIGRRETVPAIGVALCAIAAVIKLPALMGVAFVAWPWVLATSSTTKRAARMMAAGLWALVIMGLAGWATGWGWSWIDALRGATSVDAYLSVTRVGAELVHKVTGAELASILPVARSIGYLLTILITLSLLFSRRLTLPAALGWSLIFAAVFHPTTQPWYLLWGLFLMAATSAGTRNRAFIAVSSFAAFVVLPVGPQLGLVLLDDTGAASIGLVAAGLALLTFSPRPDDAWHRRGLDERLVSIVVPTRREAENIEPLLDALRRGLAGPIEVIFVDDSDDQTSDCIARSVTGEAEQEFSVRLIRRPHGHRWGGLSGAVIDGLASARGAVGVVMEADLQHPIESVVELVAVVRNGADLAIASRDLADPAEADYLKPLHRRAVVAATTLTRMLFPRRCRAVTDPLSGFFALRIEQFDLNRFHPDGFKVMVELLATHQDLTIVEVPYRSQPRHAGESKASVAQAARFFGHLLDLRVRASWPWVGAVGHQRVYHST